MKKIAFISLFIFVSTFSFSQKSFTHSGFFKSTKGVMTSLSCYCGNGGYLYFEDGQRLAICFIGEDNVPNGLLTVTGYYETKTHESSSTDPCPSGTKSVFIVESYKSNAANNTQSNNLSFEKEWNGKWSTGSDYFLIKVKGNKFTGKGPDGKISGTIKKTETGSIAEGKGKQGGMDWWFILTKETGANTFSAESGLVGEEGPVEEWTGKRKGKENGKTNETTTINYKKEWNGKWISDMGNILIKVKGNKFTGKGPEGKISGTFEKTETGSIAKGKGKQGGMDWWFKLTKENNANTFSAESGLVGEEGPVEEWTGKRK